MNHIDEMLQLGAKIIKLQPEGKKPAGDSWELTTDRKQIAKWLADGFNVGVVADDSKLVPIDLDNKHEGTNGVKLYEKKCRELGFEPCETLTETTPNKGIHVFYKADRPIPFSQDIMGAGIEIRTGKHYTVITPSMVIDDKKRPNGYELIKELAIAPLPPALETLLLSKPMIEKTEFHPPHIQTANSGTRIDAYSRKMFSNVLGDVRSAPGGTRNATLNAGAYRLGRLHAALAALGVTLFTVNDLRASLFDAAPDGLIADDGEASVRKTIESGLDAGSSKPLEFPAELFDETLSRPMSETDRPEPTEHKPTAPIIINAADLERMTFPEPVWIIPKLIPEGLSILAGKPKLGKSWLALNIALSVAYGGKVLNQIDVVKGKVLYLCLEDSYRRIQDRVKQLCNGESFPSNLSLANQWQKLNANCVKHLQEWIENNPDGRLIIIDTLKKIRTGSASGRNMYDTDYEQLCQIKAVTDKHNVGIIVVHHTRKADAEDVFDQISGSTGIAGAVDTELVLLRARGSNDLILHLTGRDIEEQSLALRFEHGSFTLLGDAEKYLLSKERQAIITALKEAAKPLRINDLSDITCIPYNNIRKTLSKMVSDRQIKRFEKGSYELLPEIDLSGIFHDN